MYHTYMMQNYILALHLQKLQKSYQVYYTIFAASIMIRENSTAMRTECAGFAYLLDVTPGYMRSAYSM